MDKLQRRWIGSMGHWESLIFSYAGVGKAGIGNIEERTVGSEHKHT